jgi:hypothetical protein
MVGEVDAVLSCQLHTIRDRVSAYYHWFLQSMLRPIIASRLNFRILVMPSAHVLLNTLLPTERRYLSPPLLLFRLLSDVRVGYNRWDYIWSNEDLLHPRTQFVRLQL